MLLVSVLVAALAGASAHAATPLASKSVIAIHGQALQDAAPPRQPAGICLVETGVDPDPGTTPILLGRETVVGGTLGDEAGVVDPPVYGHPDDHGTFMALLAAAPSNGWGLAGLAPGAVRIYSIKVAPPGSLSIPLAAVILAIDRCTALTLAGVPLRTISISVAAEANGPVPGLAAAVAAAEVAGLNVVAAAGNRPGVLAAPADAPGVLPVDASDAAGGVCAFSPTPPLAAVLAPGCSGPEGLPVPASDDGTPMLLGGTSVATPLVAATLAALRAYAPQIGPAQARG